MRFVLRRIETGVETAATNQEGQLRVGDSRAVVVLEEWGRGVLIAGGPPGELEKSDWAQGGAIRSNANGDTNTKDVGLAFRQEQEDVV